MDIISRGKAGLPGVPTSIGHRSLGSWAGITGHHTGGAFSSWKSIHDWQTKGRPAAQRLAYIGYSFGVADGEVTELRGWDHQPAGDHDNKRIQVVFGGAYSRDLPSREDLDAFVAFVLLARRRTGKQLEVIPHRGVWPAGHKYATSCPGDRLAQWMRQDLPDLIGKQPSTPKPPATPGQLAVDGRLGRATIRRWQQIMGTPTDGVISTPSMLVRAVQRHLNKVARAGLTVDGVGIRQDGKSYKTTRALQRYLGTVQDGRMSTPVSQVVKALQRRLNTGRF
ncbi:peptidoglycan recognition protein family protein [Micromonospora craniellae]|uniref:N-acetylmuramoyl-L-alanine amidase n=1 Tax=Micromonospora craniellae TaxID=2294034 RepID=A0A372G1Y0_9ACTN|nr:peptidoglycan recognition family protein [Micromonospora craniellae]QOC89887.1 N-acetylmuramoyl-L-alanine amidase [Micromonospora craniellae]RFS47032.1 N-acetylmuramoyl-L-alanine amidase [Micromonospora craniellae]